MVLTRRSSALLLGGDTSPLRRAAAQASGSPVNARQGPGVKRGLFGGLRGKGQRECAEARPAATLTATPPAAAALSATAAEPAARQQQQQQQKQPDTPPTPRTVEKEARLGSESPLTPEAQQPHAVLLQPLVAHTMAAALQGWRACLLALQPKVVVEDAYLQGAMALVQALAAARPDLCPWLNTSQPHLLAYTAAALWTACKACGTRTAIPNRTLMSLACQLHPQVLTDFELDLCLSLRWGLTGVLRAAGVLL